MAAELYRRFFNAELLDHAPDRVSTTHENQGLDVNAVAAIRAIERYQKERKHWFLGLSSSAEHVGDTRTRVLEEMKQWFLTASIDSLPAASIARRLDYCWQFLLRASSFDSQNEISFLATLGEVCRHLERLYQHTVSTETTGEAKIAALGLLGRELVEGTALVLLFAFFAPKGGASPGPALAPGFFELLAWSRALGESEIQPEESRPDNLPTLRRDSPCHRLVAALLQQAHFRELAHRQEDREESEAGAASPSSPSFPAMLAELQSTHGTEVEDPGVLGVFSTNSDLALEARRSFLELCAHLDKFCFFVVALRPYQQLAAAGGDAALCWLRRSLSHLLQELDKSLLQLRQARLALMHAAKKHLQDLAKRIGEAEELQRRWMQSLRHVDELRLDELHKACASSSTEVNALTSAVREVELKAKAKEGLQQIAAAFMNPDFQARCSLALPDRLASEMRELASNKPKAVEASHSP